MALALGPMAGWMPALAQAPASSARLSADPAATAAPLPQRLNLSLQQALELGLKGSLSLRGSTLTVQEGQALVALVRSRWLPRLDLVGLGTYGQVGTSVGFITILTTTVIIIALPFDIIVSVLV